MSVLAEIAELIEERQRAGWPLLRAIADAWRTWRERRKARRR